MRPHALAAPSSPPSVAATPPLAAALAASPVSVLATVARPALATASRGALATVALLTAISASVGPAHAQGRFRVLVPDLDPEAGAGRGFGEDVAETLRDLIDDMDTHVSVPADEVRDAIRRHGLDEGELGCIEWRQLAAQMNVEIVFCGSYAEADGQRTVRASFQGARTGDPFTVPQFTAAAANDAGARIHGAFRDYVEQLRMAAICVEYVGSDQWEEAIETCEAALAIDPAMVSALYARGRARLGLAEAGDAGPEGDARDPRRDELLRLALEDFDAVLEIRPAHEGALRSAGYAATLLGDGEMALGYYRRLLEFDPADTDIRVRLALDLANNGDPRGALALVEEGMPHAPDDLALKRYAGHFATAAGQRLAPGTRAGPAPVSPDDAGVPDSARALFEKAVEYYDGLYAAEPDSVDATTIRNMLVAYPRVGRAAEVIRIGRDALGRFPDDAALRVAFASVLKEEEDLAAAIAMMEDARRIDPEAARYDAIVGAWLLFDGRGDDAAPYFRRAVDDAQATGDEVAQLYFAYAIGGPYRAQRWAEAVPALEQVLEWAESGPVRARAHFFAGYSLLQWGIATEDGETAAAARQALPLFQRALAHLEGGRGAREAGQLDSLLDATRQYIDIEETLIRRGR